MWFASITSIKAYVPGNQIINSYKVGGDAGRHFQAQPDPPRPSLAYMRIGTAMQRHASGVK